MQKFDQLINRHEININFKIDCQTNQDKSGKIPDTLYDRSTTQQSVSIQSSPYVTPDTHTHSYYIYMNILSIQHTLKNN